MTHAVAIAVHQAELAVAIAVHQTEPAVEPKLACCPTASKTLAVYPSTTFERGPIERGTMEGGTISGMAPMGHPSNWVDFAIPAISSGQNRLKLAMVAALNQVIETAVPGPKQTVDLTVPGLKQTVVELAVPGIAGTLTRTCLYLSGLAGLRRWQSDRIPLNFD